MARRQDPAPAPEWRRNTSDHYFCRAHVSHGSRLTCALNRIRKLVIPPDLLSKTVSGQTAVTIGNANQTDGHAWASLLVQVKGRLQALRVKRHHSRRGRAGHQRQRRRGGSEDRPGVRALASGHTMGPGTVSRPKSSFQTRPPPRHCDVRGHLTPVSQRGRRSPRTRTPGTRHSASRLCPHV